jgi:hypothetical protein
MTSWTIFTRGGAPIRRRPVGAPARVVKLGYNDRLAHGTGSSGKFARLLPAGLAPARAGQVLLKQIVQQPDGIFDEELMQLLAVDDL